MSCDADKNATSTASPASAQSAACGGVKAMAAIDATSPACVSTSQPRRRPINGGVKRSISGAHRNLKMYACPTSENNPMVRISSPSTVIQACSVPEVSASGRPEAKPSNNMAPMRRLRKISR